MPPMAKRFLPTQEWSVWGRECVWNFGVVVRPPLLVAALRQGDSCFRRNGLVGGMGNCERIWHCCRRHCRRRAVALEIPAFAGMVCGGNGSVSADFGIIGNI